MSRVLIYRLGFLGDTIVSLPALHLIARAFPGAERWMLSNFSIGAKAAPVSQVLNGSGLVQGYIEYPIGTRQPRTLLMLRNEIRRLHPDVLIYLTDSRGLFKTLRDIIFFNTCGIHRLIGVPYTRDMRTCRNLGNDLYEYEGARLTRCIRELGDVRLDDPASFDLGLSGAERETAQSALEWIQKAGPFLAASIGAKVDVKDWGDKNWTALLNRLGKYLPGWGLVMVGAEVERSRSDALLNHWPGPSLNLCGRLTVRESAAALECCRLFVGHDSGPMHLAAAVGTPCVAIFSARNLPGVWFPYGEQHRVVYHSVACRDCRLEVCDKYQKRCIASISVDEVFNATMELAKETEQCAA